MSDSTLLIDANELANMLTISKRTVWRWLSAGRIPRPAIDGHTKRWVKDEILAWVRNGCPVLKVWETINKPRKS